MSNTEQVYKTDDVQLSDLVRSFKLYGWHLLKRSWAVVLWTVIFIVAGYYFAVLSPVNYKANASFNAVDARSSGSLGGLLAFASSLGLGGGGSSNDVLMGLFTSRNVVKSAFLTEGAYMGKTDKLINIYMEVEGLAENIRAVPGYEDFTFVAPDVFSMTKREDSIMSFIYEAFIDDNIEIEYDPMAGLIKASVLTPSYELSMQMCTQMLSLVDGFYTGRQAERNVKSLEVVSMRLDSVIGAMSSKEAQLTKLQNQAKFNLRAEDNVQILDVQRDLTALTFMYNEALQAREATRSSMRNPGSSINVIDHPVFATELDKRDKVFWMIIGAAIGFVLSVIFILVNKAIDISYQEEEEAKQREAEALVASV